MVQCWQTTTYYNIQDLGHFKYILGEHGLCRELKNITMIDDEIYSYSNYLFLLNKILNIYKLIHDGPAKYDNSMPFPKYPVFTGS